MYGGTILTGTQYTYIRVFLLLTVFFVKFCGYF